MSRERLSYLVTGGAGFIGSACVRSLFHGEPDSQIIVLDKLTYAANPDYIGACLESDRCKLVQGDICDEALVESLFRQHDKNPSGIFLTGFICHRSP